MYRTQTFQIGTVLVLKIHERHGLFRVETNGKLIDKSFTTEQEAIEAALAQCRAKLSGAAIALRKLYQEKNVPWPITSGATGR